MRNPNMMFIGLIGFLIVSIGDSWVYAHRIYRVNLNGPPRWLLQRHWHEPDGSIRYGTVPANSKSIDLLQGIGGLFECIGRVISDTAAAIIDNKSQIAVTEIQDHDSSPKHTHSVRKRYISHPPGGTTPRWVTKR